MARKEQAQQWLDIAQQDLQVAELTHNNGYWLYAAFFCHQALEKTIKAISTIDNVLIEPVLMEENEPSPLYRDIMRTGIAV